MQTNPSLPFGKQNSAKTELRLNQKFIWISAAALMLALVAFRFVFTRDLPQQNLSSQPDSKAILPRTFRFDNGMWFDGQKFAPKTFYSIGGILHTEYRGPVDTTIDLRNQFVIPPFADAHIHLLSDGMDYHSQIQTYLDQGIFYVKNPNNTQKFTAPIRPFVNQPGSVDVIYANGGLTASGGHPIQIYDAIAQSGYFPGATRIDMKDQAYFVVDDERDLDSQWPLIMGGKPDFIKTYLEYSEEYEQRKNDSTYYGRKGLNPKLLPKIVERAHAHRLRVSTHVNTAADFHHAVLAGVDEITHLPLAKIDENDARLAAAQGVVVVTTTLSHRPTAHVENINSVHRTNLDVLQRAGVKIALGTDNNDRTVVDEAFNIQRLEVFDNLVLLKIWLENTPQTIFPERKIGLLNAGFEATFIALAGNPLDDFSHIRNIRLRFKQGQFIHVNQGTAPTSTKPSIADHLAHTLMWKNAGEAIAEYWRLKRENPHDYNFAESELNNLGYQLLREHKVQEAIAFFSLNAEVYAQSANAFDSLADAYQAANDRVHARQCYEKVLELLPHNAHYDAVFKQRLEKNAREKLQQLK